MIPLPPPEISVLIALCSEKGLRIPIAGSHNDPPTTVKEVAFKIFKYDDTVL